MKRRLIKKLEKRNAVVREAEWRAEQAEASARELKAEVTAELDRTQAELDRLRAMESEVRRRDRVDAVRHEDLYHLAAGGVPMVGTSIVFVPVPTRDFITVSFTEHRGEQLLRMELHAGEHHSCAHAFWPRVVMGPSPREMGEELLAQTLYRLVKRHAENLYWPALAKARGWLG